MLLLNVCVCVVPLSHVLLSNVCVCVVPLSHVLLLNVCVCVVPLSHPSSRDLNYPLWDVQYFRK